MTKPVIPTYVIETLGELTSLFALMRASGVRRVKVEGAEVELGDVPRSVVPDDVATEPDADKVARANWHRHWSRVNRSSGSPIPKYPGDQ